MLFVPFDVDFLTVYECASHLRKAAYRVSKMDVLRNRSSFNRVK